MYQITGYNEVDHIDITTEIFEMGGETIADIVQAFVSREDLKRFTVQVESAYISNDDCDICGNDNLILHYDAAGIDSDGDIITYDICSRCKKALKV